MIYCTTYFLLLLMVEGIPQINQCRFQVGCSTKTSLYLYFSFNSLITHFLLASETCLQC